MNMSIVPSRALRAAFVATVSIGSTTALVGCAGSGSTASTSSTGSASSAPQKPDMGDPIEHEVSAADRAAAKSDAPIAGEGAVLYVNGLGCPLCASNIDKQLARIDGVNKVKVDLSLGRVDVGFKPGAAHPSPAALGDAVEDAGFTLVKVEAAGAAAPGGAR